MQNWSNWKPRDVIWFSLNNECFKDSVFFVDLYFECDMQLIILCPWWHACAGRMHILLHAGCILVSFYRPEMLIGEICKSESIRDIWLNELNKKYYIFSLNKFSDQRIQNLINCANKMIPEMLFNSFSISVFSRLFLTVEYHLKGAMLHSL